MDSSFRNISRYVLWKKPVSYGHVIAVLGFADKIHREYEHTSWYKIDMLLHPLTDVLSEIDFDVDVFRKLFTYNHCNILCVT